MAASPIRIKQIAFGISVATCALAGTFLIIIQPVEPSIGRDYIGRIFAICVLGGMTSIPGMVAAAMLIGIVESITATFYGPSWAPAVAFGFLLVDLGRAPGRPPGPLAMRERTLLDRRRRGRHRVRGADPGVLHQRILLLRRLCRAAIHRAVDGVEHPRRLHRLHQFRHRRVLRDGRLQLGGAAQDAGADRRHGSASTPRRSRCRS